jgi:hypothetical protein
MTITYEAGVNPEGEPFVTLRWGDQAGQLTPDTTRELAGHLFEVAEAAIHDAAVYLFLQQHLKLNRAQAAVVISQLRDYRADRERMIGREGTLESAPPADPLEGNDQPVADPPASECG